MDCQLTVAGVQGGMSSHQRCVRLVTQRALCSGTRSGTCLL